MTEEYDMEGLMRAHLHWCFEMGYIDIDQFYYNVCKITETFKEIRTDDGVKIL